MYYNKPIDKYLGVNNTFIIVIVRVILSSIFTGPLSYLLFSIGGAYISLVLISLTTGMFVGMVSKYCLSKMGIFYNKFIDRV